MKHWPLALKDSNRSVSVLIYDWDILDWSLDIMLHIVALTLKVLVATIDALGHFETG